MKRSAFIVTLFVLFSSNVSAYDVEINGIYYNADIQAMEMFVVSGDKNYSGSIVIPSQVEYGGKLFTVTKIGGGAFSDVESNYYNQDNTALTSVSLPNTIREIGSGAFARCPNLVSVNIPEACTYIDSYAFEGCSSLKKINIPKNVIAFGQYSIFSGCTSLTEIIIEDGNKEALDAGTIYGGGVGSIDAVKTCYFGRVIKFSSKNLENLTFGDSIIAIPEKRFQGIPLKLLEIPANITYIGYYSFSGLNSLSNLIIQNSNSPIKICEGAFGSSGNSNKKALYIGRDINPKTINNWWHYESFKETSDFHYIAFGEHVTTGYDSWNDNNYPKWDFSKCQDIEEIYVRKEDPFAIPFSTFCDRTYLKAILYVPIGSKQKYMECEGWKNFFTIQEMSINDMWDGSTLFKEYKNGGNKPVEKECISPMIKYKDGVLSISSETEGAKCFYSISDDDVTSYASVDSDISLSATYHIQAYAIADGYTRSKTTYATISWIDGQFESDGVNTLMTNKRAIVISSNSGTLTISGLNNGEEVICYNTYGVKIKTVRSSGDLATLSLNQEMGNVVIIKIGKDCIKTIVR